MRVLVACEQSAVVREAFRRRGHFALSCDFLPSEVLGLFHYQGDALDMLDLGWDLLIAHPPCTRLANSGVRWMTSPPKGKTVNDMQRELEEGVDLYLALRNANIPRKAIENPVMHRYARELITPGERQIVQPWWFGDPAFKATGLELINLPPLIPTNKLTPPKAGTEEHKAWSWVHREPPGLERAKRRSRTFQGIAEAMADQWGVL